MQNQREMRSNKRHKVLHGARILRADGSVLEACRMIDISGTSAKLEVKGSETLPDYFILLLSHDGRLRRQCSIVWRSDTVVGVEFIPELPGA